MDHLQRQQPGTYTLYSPAKHALYNILLDIYINFIHSIMILYSDNNIIPLMVIYVNLDCCINIELYTCSNVVAI